MRTVTFSRILDGIARLYGETALKADDQAAVAAALDDLRCTELWTHANWRELDVIEQRFFAPDYAAGTTYAEGDFVYDASTDTYYESVQDANTGNAVTNTTWWAEATGLSKTVNFVQAGKTAIGTVNAVTLHDPRLQPASANVPYVRREGALQVVGVAQTSVWVRFTRREPRFTSTAYASGTTYATGDVVYDSATGLCYESLTDSNTGNAVTDTTNWQAQEIPYFGQRFLIRAALADLYEGKDQEEKAGRHEAKAQQALDHAYYAQTRREGQFTRMEVLDTGSGQDEPAITSST
jgi:hypothetical protein